jgi:RNA polymerase sigma-70 factor (ECF subfamily)
VTALAASAPIDERELVAALRAGDERAFAELVDRYHSTLVRVAMTFVRDRHVAEDVAHDTWLGVVRGIDRFRGESSLKTWIFRILTNIANTRAVRERRTVPFSSLGEEDGHSVDEERFHPSSHPAAGHWATPPTSWPDEIVASRETLGCIRTAIEALPPMQRRVIVLRDVEGWSPEEICTLLGLTVSNQRVLLHRARSKVRAAVEAHVAD